MSKPETAAQKPAAPAGIAIPRRPLLGATSTGGVHAADLPTRTEIPPSAPKVLPEFRKFVPRPEHIHNQDLQGRDLRVIALDLIDPNPFAPRIIYTPEMLLERAESIRQYGQHDPIHVIPNPNAEGRFIIGDGWTRVQGCIQHKVNDALFAEVHHNKTAQEISWHGYQQNESHAKGTDIDKAMFYMRHINTGVEQKAIAAQAGISASLMTFYKALANLPPELMELVQQYPTRFSAYVGNQLSRALKHLGLTDALKVAVHYASSDASQSWLVNHIQSLIDAKQNKPTKPSGKLIRYPNGKFTERDGVFDLQLKIEDAAKQAAFAAELEALISRFIDKSADPDAGDAAASAN